MRRRCKCGRQKWDDGRMFGSPDGHTYCVCGRRICNNPRRHTWRYHVQSGRGISLLWEFHYHPERFRMPGTNDKRNA
jgi:hypothetical protein